MSSTPAPTVDARALRCVWPAAATLGEGTCWSVREQSLYWLDVLEHTLFRYTPGSGERQSWSFDDTISAVAERASKPGLIVTLRRGFAFFNPATGALERLHEPEPDRPKNRFNDGKCDAQGRFWGGTMDFDCVAPTGALYRYGGDGTCTLAFDAGFAVTNGPTWSLDGRTMYFSDTARRTVHAFDVDPASGALANQRAWLQFDKADGYPDGMTTDAAGRVWIAHWGGACISCHDPDNANELARVALPTDHITNVAFGGPDLTTLFITCARSGLTDAQLADQPLAGGLFALDTTVTGLPAFLFNG